jgi:hypothetical protein
MKTMSKGFDRDIGPDADNFLEHLQPQMGSDFMYEYFYGGENEDDDSEGGSQ